MGASKENWKTLKRRLSSLKRRKRKIPRDETAEGRTFNSIRKYGKGKVGM